MKTQLRSLRLAGGHEGRSTFNFAGIAKSFDGVEVAGLETVHKKSSKTLRPSFLAALLK